MPRETSFVAGRAIEVGRPPRTSPYGIGIENTLLGGNQLQLVQQMVVPHWQLDLLQLRVVAVLFEKVADHLLNLLSGGVLILLDVYTADVDQAEGLL